MDIEGNVTHWGLLGVGGQEMTSRQWGARGGIALGEIPNVDDIRVMDTASHHGTCIPM